MVDVSEKIKTLRYAKAEARIRMGDVGRKLLRENKVPKGNAYEVARVAGIMAAKRTSEILPLCHNIPLMYCDLSFSEEGDTVVITSEVKSIYHTGVEMEALTAVSVAALTLYDMLKPVEKDIEIAGIRLLEKRGGRSDFKKGRVKARASVVVVSDSVFSGDKEDRSGKLILERLKEEGIEVGRYEIVPDEPDLLERLLRELVSEGYDLILTTGGTGFSLRDYTPEATKRVIEREAPGVAEFVRVYGGERTPYSMLSRAVAGISGNSLIINLPGSRSGVRDALNALFPYIFHAFKVMRIKGGGHAEGERGP